MKLASVHLPLPLDHVPQAVMIITHMIIVIILHHAHVTIVLRTLKKMIIIHMNFLQEISRHRLKQQEVVI